MSSLLLLFLLGLLSQDPVTLDRAGARALLDELAKKLATVEYTSATYVQTRRSELLAEPLVSRGRLFCRRKPATLLFEVSEPRPTKIWVQDGTYQVYRPEQRTAERFLFESNAMWRALLSAFSPEVGRLEESFELVGFERDAQTRALTFAPRDEATQKYLRRFSFRVRSADLALLELAYVDGSGDRIELALEDYDPAPKLADAAGLFSLEPPKGVRLATTQVDGR